MWYYSLHGQQLGPVDDTALDQLLATGTVNAETFVWKDGLAQWTPLGQVRPVNVPVPAGDAAPCAMCGKKVGSDNLVDILDVSVCAECKPKAVQAMREGISPTLHDAAWSDGKKVVTRDGAVLPRRCYKCNKPADEKPLKRKLTWHPPQYYWLAAVGIIIHLGLIIYIIVAIFVRKKATVEIHFCSEHLQRRKYLTIGSWTGAGLGLALLITGITMSYSLLIAGSLVLILGSLIAGLIGGSIGRATRMKDGSVWMSGAGKPFLASLPEWK